MLDTKIIGAKIFIIGLVYFCYRLCYGIYYCFCYYYTLNYWGYYCGNYS